MANKGTLVAQATRFKKERGGPFGFKEIGNTYLEDGIEHINMVLK